MMEKTTPRDGSQRNVAIDLLRGLVMVLMALDHVRDYYGDMRQSPQNMATTTPIFFATRWVTHFCAPVFVFLAGVSAAIYGSRREKGELSRFLLSRGVWLILLEFTLIYFAWMLTFRYGWVFVQVIAAIGFGMVCLAGLIHLPRWAQLAIGLGILLGHNLVEGAQVTESGLVGAFAYGGPFTFANIGGVPRFIVIYALVPWAAVMLIGYCAGGIFAKPKQDQRRILLRLGCAATIGFLLLRWSDVYGDPISFASHLAGLEEAGASSFAMSVVAFLNTTKYPPSLLYLLMTLGPALIFLGLCTESPGRLGRACVNFGRVPLFYYVAHLFLIHLGSTAYYLVLHGEAISPMQGIFDTFMLQPPKPLPEWYGNGLEVVYVAWIATVLALYPLCAWYGRLKRRGRSRLWSYL